MSDLRLIHSTVASRDSARNLAESLVETNRAACVSIGSAVDSVYRWEGSVHHDEEIPLTIKTTEKHLEGAMDFLEENHPYDCPELIVTVADDASDEYEAWARDQVD